MVSSWQTSSGRSGVLLVAESEVALAVELSFHLGAVGSVVFVGVILSRDFDPAPAPLRVGIFRIRDGFGATVDFKRNLIRRPLELRFHLGHGFSTATKER